jgi:hypothetical protein
MTPTRLRSIAIIAIIAAASGCGGGSADGSTTAPRGTDGPAGTTATTGASGETPPESAAPTSAASPATDAPLTEPTVVIVVEGTAVAGNSGGEGKNATQPLSESVRNQDGSCSGWEGPGDAGQWTQGLEVGAPVQLLDQQSGKPIGEGTITASSWADVDPDGNDQWNCTFAFKATMTGAHEAFKIKVADLQPWSARPDSATAGHYVASVDTKIEISRISSCTDHQAGEPIFEWQSVGQFWSDGLNSLCGNGLIVDKVQRPCRPPRIASEYIVAVRSADDPNVVYEDSSGLLVDVATLAPDTKVIVDVATGRPC